MELTVATVVLSLAQVTTRPVSAVPFASLGVAVSCAVAPTPTVKVRGVTVTDATVAGGPSLWQVANSRTAATASRRLSVCAIVTCSLIRSPRGIGEPHNITPRGSWHLS